MWRFIDLAVLAQVCIGTAGVSLFFLLSYYLILFTRALRTADTATSTAVPISVIIAARNEKNNLTENLASILTQDYPSFEVIVVNDSSWDGTRDLLKMWSDTYENLKIVTLEIDERFQKGKKFALTMGIKAAQYEHLLFTDADCTPSSDKWISLMANALQRENTDLVLGNSPLITKRNILGSLVNYETFHTALQYFSYANRGMAYMGVGRNMGYTKSLFFKHKGFAAHQHILSGDDDLFVQQAANNTNVSTVISAQAHTYSLGPENMSTWIKQKTRHLSTSSAYKPKYKMLLGLYSLVQVIFYVALLVLLIQHPDTWNWAAALLVTKWLVLWMVAYKPAKVLGYKRISYALPYYDILYTGYLLLFSILKPFSKNKTWN